MNILLYNLRHQDQVLLVISAINNLASATFTRTNVVMELGRMGTPVDQVFANRIGGWLSVWAERGPLRKQGPRKYGVTSLFSKEAERALSAVASQDDEAPPPSQPPLEERTERLLLTSDADLAKSVFQYVSSQGLDGVSTDGVAYHHRDQAPRNRVVAMLNRLVGHGVMGIHRRKNHRFWFAEPVAESVAESVPEPVPEPVAEPVAEPVGEHRGLEPVGVEEEVLFGPTSTVGCVNRCLLAFWAIGEDLQQEWLHEEEFQASVSRGSGYWPPVDLENPAWHKGIVDALNEISRFVGINRHNSLLKNTMGRIYVPRALYLLMSLYEDKHGGNDWGPEDDPLCLLARAIVSQHPARGRREASSLAGAYTYTGSLMGFLKKKKM